MVSRMGIVCAFALGSHASFMKVALTLLSGIGYGGMTYFQNLIPALARADKKNEYHLFVPQGHPLCNAVRQPNFIFHECLRNNHSALKRFLWEQLVLPRELKKYNIDILFTAKNMNVFLASCKTVIAGRNMEPLAYREYDNAWQLNRRSWIKWQFTKWSVAKADHIVAVSQAVKDRFVKRFPGIEKRVTVVYNGNPVTPPHLPLDKGRQGGVKPFLLTASKFVAYANQLNLLEGYALLRKRMPDVPPLWLAGGVHDKKYFAKMKEFVRHNGLHDRVKFLGLIPHDRLLELMHSAQAFIFPSTLESCPHTLIEAMACGVPIAASTTPPMPEICGKAAVYFNPHDPDDIAKKMEHVLLEKFLREKLHSDALERSAFFTWEKTARELVAVFDRLF